MTLEEMKALENIAIHQIEEGKRYLVVVDFNAFSRQAIEGLHKGFEEFFGAKAAIIRRLPAGGTLELFEIKP